MNTIRKFLLKALVFLGLIWPNIASAWTNPFAGSSRVTNGLWSCAYACYHLGADIVPSPLDGGVNAEDVEVRSICTGDVKQVVYNPDPYQQNYGGRILIECETDDNNISEGVVTVLYGHFGIKPGTEKDADVYFSVGDTVTEGVAIGRLGNSSENSGFIPHLHLGISRGSYDNSKECKKWRYGGYAPASLDPSDACYCKLLDNWYDPEVILGEKEKSLRIVSGSVSPEIGTKQTTTFTWTLEATGGYGAPIRATVLITNAVTGNEFPFIMEYVAGTSNPNRFTYTGTLNDIGTYGYRFKIETCADKVEEELSRSGPTTNEGQVQCVVLPEVCNNYDDDCDGRIDDDVFRPCTNECGNSGTQTCYYGMWETYCDADACEVSSSSSARSSSSSATRSSSSSRGQSSSTSRCVPQEEVCNNRDDNCDGFVDEDIYSFCTNECGNRGTQTCYYGMWETYCDADPCCVPNEEICDGRDNDCDGDIDEDIQVFCMRPPCYNEGVKYCVAGYLTDCNAQACPVSSSSSSHRSSSAARSSSSSRGQSSSTSSCISQPEVCNNRDDNCDRRIDENLSRSCTNNCGNYGTQSCTAGIWGTCNATACCVPSEEICDGRDNDCDGDIDEQIEVFCMRPPCYNGGYQYCVAGYLTDCDAQMCQVSSSSSARSSSSSSSTATTYSSSSRAQSSSSCIPQTEVCDGRDNNCNERVDEELSRSCSNACGNAGTQTCINGGWSTCNATACCVPQPEVCDYQDNDCDLLIDEDLTQSCTNECGNPGSKTCINGGWSMCNATACCVPQPEVCDNRDNDCDLLTDEDLVQSCTNECGNPGSKRCTSGIWSVCDATACPNPTLDAPRILSPADRFIKAVNFGVSASVTLDWDVVSGAAKYEYEIRYGGDSGDLYTQGETTTGSSYRFPCTTTEYGTEFHWKARAVSAAGVRGAWSETRAVFFSYQIGSIIKCADSACPYPDAWYKVSRDIYDSGLIGTTPRLTIHYVSAACAGGLSAHSLNFDEMQGYSRSAEYGGCPP